MSEAFSITVITDVWVEGACVIITLVLDRLVLVTSVQVDSRSDNDSLASSVLLDCLRDRLGTYVHVTKLDATLADSLISGKLLPLNGELDAAAASWVDVSDHPNVLSVCSYSLFEGLNFDTVEFLPNAVVLLDNSRLIYRCGLDSRLLCNR